MNEEIIDKENEVKHYKSLEAVAKSDGGKLLIKELKTKIADNINFLINDFETLPEIQLRTICAKIEAALGQLRMLNRAEKNAKVSVAELEQLLEEAKEE